MGGHGHWAGWVVLACTAALHLHCHSIVDRAGSAGSTGAVSVSAPAWSECRAGSASGREVSECVASRLVLFLFERASKLVGFSCSRLQSCRHM